MKRGKYKPAVPALLRVFFTVFAVLSIGISLVFSACSGEKETAYVPDDYSSWQQTTDIELRYPIPGHEDNYRRIYINPEGLEFRSEMSNGGRQYFFPEGTVIIKEVYDGFNPAPGETPRQLTVMVKKADHPDALGGWLWIVKNPGEPGEHIVTNEFCLTCHSNANEPHPYGDRNPESEFRDYVFFIPSR